MNVHSIPDLEKEKDEKGKAIFHVSSMERELEWNLAFGKWKDLLQATFWDFFC